MDSTRFVQQKGYFEYYQEQLFAQWGQILYTAAFEFAVSRTKPFQTTSLNFYSSIDFMILRIDISNSRSKTKGLDL